MTDTKTTPKAPPLEKRFSSQRAKLAAPLIALSLVLVSCSDSNQSADVGNCDSAVENAKKLDSIIGGDVAAFILADRSQSLRDLKFNDKDGTEVTLASFAGKTTLINLWATWCAPCRAEMPSIERLHTEMSGDNFTVVPISVDSGNANKPKSFYDEIGLSKLPFFHDGTIGAFKTFQKMSLALGLPATVIVDKKGCVLGKLNGPAEWDSADAKKLVKAAIELD